MVEKVKRDVRITTIYEGTSEIMEMTIARDRWQAHLKTRGQYYHDAAAALEALHRRRPEVGANIAALAAHALADVLERARLARLTRHQHILLRFGELIAWCEGAAALVRRAAAMADGTLDPRAPRRFDAEALAALARVFAREAARKVSGDGLAHQIGAGGGGDDGGDALAASLGAPAIRRAQAGQLADLDRVADALYRRGPTAA